MTAGRYARERESLLEAVREVQLVAGLSELRFAANEARDCQAGSMLAFPEAAGLGRRGFKAMRGSHSATPGRTDLAEVEPGAARSVAIGVTSVGYGDGKTTMAIALASCLAEDFGAHVTLVDADFHTASVAAEYGLEGRKGLADVLDGEVSLPSVTHRFLRAPLSVVTAGSGASSPARIARSERLVELIDTMKASSGFVVLDLPATLHSMSAPVLAQRCDGILLVVRSGSTSRQEVDRALHLLRGSNVLGVVINRHRSHIPGWAVRLLGLAS